MDEIKNKSIKLKQSTIKKIWTIADLTGLKQGEVIEEAIKLFYPQAMDTGQTFGVAKEYLIKVGYKKPENAIRVLKKHYGLGKLKSDTPEQKEQIYLIIDKYIEEVNKMI